MFVQKADGGLKRNIFYCSVNPLEFALENARVESLVQFSRATSNELKEQQHLF